MGKFELETRKVNAEPWDLEYLAPWDCTTDIMIRIGTSQTLRIKIESVDFDNPKVFVELREHND